MPIEFAVLRKQTQASDDTFREVESIARRFLSRLNSPEVSTRIAQVHKLGASSAEVQAIIEPAASMLGFVSERKGLFAKYAVPSLRPDFFAAIGETGILLEVERGKTTTNNMDLLDLWKCHICEHADYLFLVVPRERPSANGRVLRHFKQVHNRLGTFFVPANYVNVEGVFVFGY